MKKFQKAFAIALIIISIIGTVWETDIIENIIYAVVIPSFILSLISFVSDISEKCQKDAEETASTVKKLSDLEEDLADKDLELYNKGIYEEPFVEGLIPEKIYQRKSDSYKHLKEAITYKEIEIFCYKCKKLCDKLIIFGYVLLIISLCMSPYFMQLLNSVNLNCITLWSLTLLYITLELKQEICSKTYNSIYSAYKKLKVKKEKNSRENNDSDCKVV